MSNQDGVSKALRDWIAPDTWNKGHSNDRNRFYKFVDELCGAKYMDEVVLRGMIINEIRSHHPNFNSDAMKGIVNARVRTAREIYDYVMHVV